MKFVVARVASHVASALARVIFHDSDDVTSRVQHSCSETCCDHHNRNFYLKNKEIQSCQIKEVYKRGGLNWIRYGLGIKSHLTPNYKGVGKKHDTESPTHCTVIWLKKTEDSRMFCLNDLVGE